MRSDFNLDTFKKILKLVVFPPIPFIILMFPVAYGGMFISLALSGAYHYATYAFYALAAYELGIICVHIPKLIKWIGKIRKSNRYINRFESDAELRTKISLYSTVLFNTVYAAFMVWMGIVNRSFWFFSLAAYYVMLDVVRFCLLRHMRSADFGQRRLDELKRYRFCGKMLAYLNIALAFMIFFVVYWNRGYEYNYIVTIAMAAYTFTTVAVSIVNVVKYRKYNSPVMSATRAISLAAAAVSMLTLETAMLTAFGGDNGPEFRRMMTLTTGIAVFAFILAMAIYMIVRANKQIKKLKEELSNGQ